MWTNTGKLTGRNQLPSWLSGNEPSYQYRRHKSHGFEPWVGKTLEDVWQPNAVFLAAESHGQKSLAGYSPWSHSRVGHLWSNLACIHAWLVSRGPGGDSGEPLAGGWPSQRSKSPALSPSCCDFPSQTTVTEGLKTKDREQCRPSLRPQALAQGTGWSSMASLTPWHCTLVLWFMSSAGVSNVAIHCSDSSYREYMDSFAQHPSLQRPVTWKESLHWEYIAINPRAKQRWNSHTPNISTACN